MQIPLEMSRTGWRSHLAIALVSSAILLFEILITRVLSVTLFWATNGAARVLVSVLALVLSLLFGFFRVIAVALVCYAIAALLGHHNGESQPDG